MRNWVLILLYNSQRQCPGSSIQSPGIPLCPNNMGLLAFMSGVQFLDLPWERNQIDSKKGWEKKEKKGVQEKKLINKSCESNIMTVLAEHVSPENASAFWLASLFCQLSMIKYCTMNLFQTNYQTNSSYSSGCFTRSIQAESLSNEQKAYHLSSNNITPADVSCYKL